MSCSKLVHRACIQSFPDHRAGLSMQQRLEEIFGVPHNEQRYLLWASVNEALKAEAAETALGNLSIILNLSLAGLSMQQRLDGIFKLLHKEQRKLLWASVKRALEVEAAEMEAGDTTHALIQNMVSSAASESPGTQELAAMLLDCFLKASQADCSRGRGKPQ